MYNNNTQQCAQILLQSQVPLHATAQRIILLSSHRFIMWVPFFLSNILPNTILNDRKQIEPSTNVPPKITTCVDNHGTSPGDDETPSPPPLIEEDPTPYSLPPEQRLFYPGDLNVLADYLYNDNPTLGPSATNNAPAAPLPDEPGTVPSSLKTSVESQAEQQSPPPLTAGDSSSSSHVQGVPNGGKHGDVQFHHANYCSLTGQSLVSVWFHRSLRDFKRSSPVHPREHYRIPETKPTRQTLPTP